MANEKQEKEVPIFRVTMAPGFATGMELFPPGSEIRWEVPEGWNEKKLGKHYASNGPSLTFEPLNDAASRLLDQHRKSVSEMNKPKPTADQQMAEKMQAMHMELMNKFLEQQSEHRRTQDALTEALEALSKKK